MERFVLFVHDTLCLKLAGLRKGHHRMVNRECCSQTGHMTAFVRWLEESPTQCEVVADEGVMELLLV